MKIHKSRLALYFHLTIAILSWAVLESITYGSKLIVVVSRASALVITSVITALLLGTFVWGCFPDGAGGRTSRILRLAAMCLISFLLVRPIVVVFGAAWLETREFWGEDCTVEKMPSYDEPASAEQRADLQTRARSGIAEKGPAWLSLSADIDPKYCIGAVNPREPGELFVKIVDVSNDAVIFETQDSWPSKMVAGWSQNEDELFPFCIQCRVPCGRSCKWYVVRCELWILPQNGLPGKKLMEARVKVRGAY